MKSRGGRGVLLAGLVDQQVTEAVRLGDTATMLRYDSLYYLMVRRSLFLAYPRSAALLTS